MEANFCQVLICGFVKGLQWLILLVVEEHIPFILCGNYVLKDVIKQSVSKRVGNRSSEELLEKTRP